VKRVLFVSKPITPPWHDGSKNFVRDIASHLVRTQAVVMATPDAPSIGARVEIEPIYRDSGGFAPGLSSNARVARRLMFGTPFDIWHFVFAPNRASSTVAKIAIRSRRMRGWKGQVVQTIASAPKVCDPEFLFGDIVVTMSEHTRKRYAVEGADPNWLRVIPPCAPPPTRATREAQHAFRLEHGLGDSPVVVFPGDYEVSSGAEMVARATKAIVQDHPNTKVVFACRPKTARSADAKAQIMTILADDKVAECTRHVGELDGLATLLSIASVVAFPVDDLYGKVDLPLALLEALALGVPLVLARGGPLEEIAAARFVPPRDAVAVAHEVTELLRSPAELPDHGRALYLGRFRPGIVAAQYDDLYDHL
jgi:glycosyltransferase involved in cell wall biosynthesis